MNHVGWFCFIISAVFLSSPLRGETKSNSTFGADVNGGYTSNANYTKDSPNADTFYKVGALAKYKTNEHSGVFRLNYVNYQKETVNNALSFRLSDDLAMTGMEGWRFNGALVGYFYTNNGPGTTDTSFSNYGGNFSIRRELENSKDQESRVGAGYRLRYYPAFSTRVDHNLYGTGGVDWNLDKNLDLDLNIEAGGVFSRDSDYSRLYAQLSATLDYEISKKWLWTSGMGLTAGVYTVRTVAADTEVTRRRGAIRPTAKTSQKEAYQQVTASTEIMRRETDSIQYGLSMVGTNQTSRSGQLDYSVFEVLASLIFNN